MNVLTQHNDNFRTGANLSEYVLTVSNVNTGQFGKLFSRAVDGQIYAQPLYVSGLIISNKLRNVVYVATEHNSVYAFDADDPTASNALWHVNLGQSISTNDIEGCDDLQPEIGITSTPVIDLTSETMYVSAKTKEIAGSVTNYFHRLHALDLLTGQENLGGTGVTIQGSVPGNAKGSNAGTLTFDPRFSLNRAGLLLLSNTVYVAFGSHCDFSDYHGWMFGYNATNLQRTAIFCTTPNGGDQSVGGGIWGSGMGPSADADGHIYVTTGNGNFSINTGGTELSDCFIKLSVSNGTLAVADWFAPHDQAFLGSNDLDVAAGGPVVLPNTNLVVGIGKAGEVYLLNRQHLGGFVNFSSDTNIVQEFLASDQPYFIGQSPVYWKGPTNEFLYFWPNGMPLTAYSFNGSLIATNPIATGSKTQTVGRAGGISLSANTNAPGSGILWGTESTNNVILHAYEANNVAHELWNSQQLPARDAVAKNAKFCAPTIANGKVYVATFSSNLVVYGLLSPDQGVSPASYNFGTLATGTTAQTTFVVTDGGGGALTGTVATAGPFTIVGGGSYTVASGGSTNVVVSFTPTSPGSFSNSVIFTSNGGVSTNPVTGTALTPGSIAVTPATLNFGALVTGTTAQASFVVTNSGGIAVSNGTAIVSGGPFTIVFGATFSVSGLGSTNVVVSFAPVSAGGFTNTVVFTTANGGNATNTVIGAGAVPPTASFTAHPIAGTEPLGATFSDTSTGTPPFTLVWNLGDTVFVTNSGSASFNHTYAAGTYTVALTASNAFGTSTLVSNNLISVVTALQAWQLHYFGCTNCSQAQPNADPFGTGISNTNRFLAGFNPTNPVAYPHVISIANTNTTDITLIYLGANGDNTWSPGIVSRTNVLEFTAGAAGGGYSNNFVSANVTNILSGGTGTGIVTNMVEAGAATNTPSRYYRVRVLVP